MYRAYDQDGLTQVVVLVCDVCGRPINAADPGGPAIPRVLRMGKDYFIRHAHKGRCLQVLEEELAREDYRDRD